MFNGKMLQTFLPASEVDIKEIITKSPNNSCDLDSPPAWLLKKCVDQRLSLIRAIINRSMAESVIPLSSERTIITRSIPLISTLIEKVVASGIEEHLENNQFHQSYTLFNRNYFKMRSNVDEALDEGSMAALIKFYLAAAFDVVDHPILPKHLELTKDKVEPHRQWWIKTSPDIRLYFGVLKEFVLAPDNFCTDTKPLPDVIKWCNIKCYYCADDA